MNHNDRSENRIRARATSDVLEVRASRFTSYLSHFTFVSAFILPTSSFGLANAAVWHVDKDNTA